MRIHKTIDLCTHPSNLWQHTGTYTHKHVDIHALSRSTPHPRHTQAATVASAPVDDMLLDGVVNDNTVQVGVRRFAQAGQPLLRRDHLADARPTAGLYATNEGAEVLELIPRRSENLQRLNVCVCVCLCLCVCVCMRWCSLCYCVSAWNGKGRNINVCTC